MTDTIGIANPEDLTSTQQPGTVQQRNILVVAKEGSLVLVGAVVGMAMNYLTTLLMTRTIGIESWGIFRFAWSITSILSILAALGLRQAVVRFGAVHAEADEEAKLASIIIKSISMSLVTGFVGALALGTLAPWFSSAVLNKPYLAPVLAMLAVTIPFAAATSILVAGAQACKVTWMLILVNNIAFPICALMLSLVLVATGQALRGVIVAHVTATVLATLLAYYLLRRLLPGLLRKRESASVSRGALLRFSLPLMIVNLLEYTYERTETIFLGIMVGMVEVGIYDVAVRTASFLIFPLQALIVIFAPFAADLYERGAMTDLESLYKTIAQWSFTAALMVFTIFLLFSEPILRLFGSDVGQYGTIALIILSASQLVNAGVGPAGSILAMTGKSGFILFNTVALLVSSIALDLALIPRYGLIGAAIAGSFAVLLVNLLRLTQVYYVHRMHPFRSSLWKPVAAAGIAAGITYLLKLSFPVEYDSLALFVLSPIFLILLVFFLYRLRLSHEDMMVWTAIQQRLNGLLPISIKGSSGE